VCLLALGCSSDGERRAGDRKPKPRSAKSGNDGGALAKGSSADADGAEEPEEDAAEPAAPAGAARGRGGRNPQTAEDALSDLRETHRSKAAEAAYHKKLGAEAYAELDYKRAVEEYGHVLELNPADGEARERWARASLVLGLRSGEVEAIRSELIQADQVRKQERLSDAKRGVQEGRDLLAQGDLDDAERKFRKVYEELLWFEYPEDITQLRAEAKGLIDEVARQKRDRSSDLQKKQQDLAQNAAQEALEQEQRVRDQRVRELVRKAADYIRLKDYDKAIDACNRILALKPDHRVAKFWLKDVKRQQADQQRRQLFLDRIENQKLTRESLEASAVPYTDIFVFPGEEEWNHTRKRKDNLEVISLEDDESIAKIKRVLEADKLTFDFQQRPLKEALQFISQSTGVNILVDSGIETEELKIANLTGREMKAMDALSNILTATGLAYTFKEGTLYITAKDKAKDPTEFHIYNVSDILNKIRNFEGPELKLKSQDDSANQGGGGNNVSFSSGSAEEQGPIDPTALIELIKEGSGGDEKWGNENNIEFHKGQLLVNATKELHGLIGNTLQNLREDSDLFVVLEARFIDVNEDFLEDIGVDTRALGLGSNFGTPFGNIINNNQTGGNDLGFVKKGSPVRDVTLIMGQDRWGGRVQHIIDGFTGLVQGDALTGGPQRVGGLTAQATWLEPFQINVILRAVQERSDVRQLTAPIVTAHNGQRVYVSVITQRAYIADYELVSGGTGFQIIEVADPVVQTFQEGVILDVDPVISPDKKYITLDVRPTLATLIGGIISTIRVSLGSFTNVANQVPIGVPEITLQQSFTSVTVPNGGTVLLGGFKALNDRKYVSYIPLLGKIPIVKNLFRRRAEISEKQTLVILMTARIVDLRLDERTRYNE